MYIATIKNKGLVDGRLRVQVEFSNGANTPILDFCDPSDENGLKYWVRGRLSQLNFSTEVDSKYPDGTEIKTSDQVVNPTPTEEEIARAEWFKNYMKWTKIKTTLIDTGVLTGNETKLATLKAKVQSDFIPAYLDII